MIIQMEGANQLTRAGGKGDDMTTQKERYEVLQRLERARISYEDANKFRRIALTLHRWHALECGDGNGHIERDEQTGIPRYYNDNACYVDPNDPRRAYVIPDREAGALKRLKEIMRQYSRWFYAYVQGDPRGPSLYLVRRKDVPKGERLDGYYSRGIAIY